MPSSSVMGVVGRSLPFQRTTEPATKAFSPGPYTDNLLSTPSMNCSPAGAQLGARVLIVGTGLALDPLDTDGGLGLDPLETG